MRLKPHDLIKQFNFPSLKTLRFQNHSNSQIEKSCFQDERTMTQLCMSASFPMHIASTHKHNTHSTVHSNRSTSTSYSTRLLKNAKAIQMSFSRSFTYLQRFTYRCPSRPWESCFSPSGPIRHQKTRWVSSNSSATTKWDKDNHRRSR